MIYIMVKETRGSDEEGSPPQMNVTLNYNNDGTIHTTSPISSWEPSWNQIFYFPVNDARNDTVRIALHQRRGREATCIGICNLEVNSYYVPYGYYAPMDKWQVLMEPNTNQPTESFVRLIVQLVPENIESFANLANETIRILPNTKQYIEQFGAHLKKNKLKSQS